MTDPTPPADPLRPTRVVVVGRTGLDHRLRLDPAVELIRARSGYDALGELSEVSEGDGHRAPVVLVGEGVASSVEEAAQLVEALRRVDPAVRVVRVEPAASGGPRRPTEVAAPFDAVVMSDASGEALRGALGLVGPSGSAVGALGEQPRPGSAERSAGPQPAVGPPPSVGSRERDDSELVHLLMRGLDIVPTALELIRRRSGDVSVSLSASAEAPGVVVRAEPHGAVVGVMRADRLPVEAVEQHARWLGAWMSLAAQHTELRDAALRDHLTGAWNRRYLDRFLPAALDQCARRRHALTLLIFDIDNFKQFNDAHGHAAGDEILRETVRLLQSVTRPHDRICRFGGDEFAVVFYEPDGPRDPGSMHPSSVFEIAARFQQRVVDQCFPKLGHEAPGTLTISGGLATFPWDGRTAGELVARADELAYHSKQQGKNVITLGPGAARLRDQ